MYRERQEQFAGPALNEISIVRNQIEPWRSRAVRCLWRNAAPRSSTHRRCRVAPPSQSATTSRHGRTRNGYGRYPSRRNNGFRAKSSGFYTWASAKSAPIRLRFGQKQRELVRLKHQLRPTPSYRVSLHWRRVGGRHAAAPAVFICRAGFRAMYKADPLSAPLGSRRAPRPARAESIRSARSREHRTALPPLRRASSPAQSPHRLIRRDSRSS